MTCHASRCARLRFARWALALASALVVLLFAPVAFCEPGEELTVSVLTFGPGDHPFYKFGHNAILVHDAQRNRDDVYNFGTFSFRSRTLFSDFLKGRLRYWLSVQSLTRTIATYRAENRSIVAQQLALAPAERRTLADRLQRNARSDERYYKYDYYRDNCSTRVRDAIDSVVGGRLRAASTAPAEMTFRAHTERLTADDIPVYLGLDVAMGHFIDGAVSQWDEMFLPEKLQESLRRVTIPTASGDTPLVVAETVLLSANRAPLRTTPPSRTVPMAVVGVLIGGLLAVLGRLGTRHRPARVAFGVLVAALAFAIGALGCVLVLLWAGTDHEVAYRNENVLQCAPWALLLGIAATRLAVKREGGERAAWAAALLALAFSALGLVLKALPPFHQVNGHIIALVLPLWVGTAAGCLAFVRRTPVTGIRAPERKPDVE